MAQFVLLGSKGGAGRTASSVVLSAGLAALGLRPLHLQITMSGVRPVIASAKGVPFSTAAIAEHDATSAAIEAEIATHPECSSVVIDMVKRPIWETALNCPDTVALFPMRRGADEIETAMRDCRSLQPYQSSVCDPYFRPRWTSSSTAAKSEQRSNGCLLPVAWAEDLGDSAIDSAVERFYGPTRTGLSHPQIVWPGIPEFSRDDLDDLINTSDYACSPAISEAAMRVAQSILELCT